MAQKELLYRGKKLTYTLQGTGPAVVLLHGFGEDNTVWREQMAALNHHLLIVPNLPGSGASAMQEDMSMEGLAKSVEAILQHEGIGQCVLIGHSMGGYVTLAFAEMFPQRLQGFGLFHSTAFADTEEKIATRKKGMEFIKNNGGFAFLKTVIPNLFAPATKESRPELIDAQINAAKGFADAALLAYYASMIIRPDRTAVLTNTRLPVLFILGRHDGAVPLKDGLQQAHLPGLSYIHILESSGHMGMLEETEKANAILKMYLKNINVHTA